MTLLQNAVSAATVSDAPEMASWQRPRSRDELLGFIARREAILGNSADGLGLNS